MSSSDTYFDPWCNPEQPRKVTFHDVTSAAYDIQTGVLKTPCTKSHFFPLGGKSPYLKCEFLQFTGSFKERGARNALLNLDSETKRKGVIVASLGNHSQGISYHGKLLGIPTTVVMPFVAPLMKVQKCRQFGANVVLYGRSMVEAKRRAFEIAKEKGLTYINGYDHPHIIAGQGVVGLEILEQVPDVEAILVPCGGGGLLAGIASAVKHLKKDCLIYGVETDNSASMTNSLKAGKPTYYDIGATIADGLAVGNVGVNSFQMVRDLVDRMVVVSEDWTARAILKIAELEKYIVEGGGAVPIAAILAGLVPELQGKRVVCVLTGGNIDTYILRACFERGLIAEYRLYKFKVIIPKFPGCLAELAGLIADTGISIKEIDKEFGWIQGNIFNVRVIIVVETAGPEQAQMLREVIKRKYKQSFFPVETKTHPQSLTESFTNQ